MVLLQGCWSVELWDPHEAGFSDVKVWKSQSCFPFSPLHPLTPHYCTRVCWRPLLPKEKKDKKDKQDKRLRPKPKDAQGKAKAKAKAANGEENAGGEPAKRRKKKDEWAVLGFTWGWSANQCPINLYHPKVLE